MNHDEKVANLVNKVVVEFNESLARKIPVEQGSAAPLYGQDGGLDSLGFVTFVVAVEQAVEEEMGISITLADEKAMSQRNSPFRTVGTLVDYISALIAEKAAPEQS